MSQTTGSMVVRLPLSMVPAGPRFVRRGDRFQAGAVLTNTGSSTLYSINVTAWADDTSVLVLDDSVLQGVEAGEATQVVPSLAAGASVEVGFAWTAAAQGNGVVTVQASTSSSSPSTTTNGGDAQNSGENSSPQEDAFTLVLPSIAVQQPVLLATSFVLGGKETTQGWTEGVVLPDAVPNSGVVNTTVGVGQLPSLMALTAAVNSNTPAVDATVTADWALSAVVGPLVVGVYKKEVGVEGEVGYEGLVKRAVDALMVGEGTLTDSTQGTWVCMGLMMLCHTPLYT